MNEKRNVLGYFVDCISKDYFNFSGRARRMEFWSFTLISFLLMFLTISISDAYGITEIIIMILAIGLFIPSLSVGARRLHDIGKDATMLMIYFIPVIGYFWLMILFLTSGTKGPNRFGQDPKNSNVGDEIDQIGSG
ncbi:MAG: DUF805 domain-containing protein [Bacteroidia bacterium]